MVVDTRHDVQPTIRQYPVGCMRVFDGDDPVTADD
jgi:hypothetical protein